MNTENRPLIDWSLLDSSTSQIAALLRRENIALKRSWGQNFLLSGGARHLARQVAEIATPQQGQLLWEIGPGLGALSAELIGRCRMLELFEIDRGLVRLLQRRFADSDTLRIHSGDATILVPALLQKPVKYYNTMIYPFTSNPAEAHADAPAKLPDVVVGALPYSTALRFVTMFATVSRSVPRLLFIVQREAAERLMALPGSGLYSAVSIAAQVRYHLQRHWDIAPDNFYPAPRVHSSLLELRLRDDASAHPLLLQALVRLLFAARRRTIGNNIARLHHPRHSRPRSAQHGLADQLLQNQLGDQAGQRIEDALRREGIALSARAETLPPQAFMAVSGHLEKDIIRG